MADEPSESSMLRRFKEGDKDAANHLFEKYMSRIQQAAQRRLDQHRLTCIDAEDVALSAMESVWRKASQQHFSSDDLTSEDEFWRLLCTIMRFKANDHLRRELAQKRGGGNVGGESVFAKLPSGALGIEGYPESGPEIGEAMVFREQQDGLMHCLPSDEYREIVTRRLEGQSVAEIAEVFECTDRSIKRKLSNIREFWTHHLTETCN